MLRVLALSALTLAPWPARAGDVSVYAATGLGGSEGFLVANRSAYEASGYRYAGDGQLTCCAAAEGRSRDIALLLLAGARWRDLLTLDVAYGGEGGMGRGGSGRRVDVTLGLQGRGRRGSWYTLVPAIAVGGGYGVMWTDGPSGGVCCEDSGSTRRGPTASVAARIDTRLGRGMAFLLRLEGRVRGLMTKDQEWAGEGSIRYHFSQPGYSLDWGLTMFAGIELGHEP